jgi:hypothetical protein
MSSWFVMLATRSMIVISMNQYRVSLATAIETVILLAVIAFYMVACIPFL